MTLRATRSGLAQDLIFNSVEAAYQAAKCADPNDCLKFLTLDALQAKRFGKQIQVRADWNGMKESLMLELVMQKFLIPDLARRLLETGDAELIEGNRWGDTFWGVDVCFGCGANKLGVILMRVPDFIARLPAPR